MNAVDRLIAAMLNEQYATEIAQERAKVRNEPRWHCTEPGVLALINTRMHIEYTNGCNCHPFRVYEGVYIRAETPTLEIAKHYAEHWWAELEEIGAA